MTPFKRYRENITNFINKLSIDNKKQTMLAGYDKKPENRFRQEKKGVKHTSIKIWECMNETVEIYRNQIVSIAIGWFEETDSMTFSYKMLRYGEVDNYKIVEFILDTKVFNRCMLEFVREDYNTIEDFVNIIKWSKREYEDKETYLKPDNATRLIRIINELSWKKDLMKEDDRYIDMEDDIKELKELLKDFE